MDLPACPYISSVTSSVIRTDKVIEPPYGLDAATGCGRADLLELPLDPR